ncbi:CAP domain-containing protein [Myxococcus sp. K15C18031901]|uniref:CAP domain-containing protein n=1 Tax=Myxococcus dinghuensis TaxID=2906761 RepID=UPI0020A7A109|nr:CAP domain-containing protein [Myxococcus dinghuensis]MCP3102717.1 CAP domain-containing protein [Myxococcus dinghuensis]
MSRPSIRHLLAIGLLVPWLATSCGSDDDDNPPDGGAPDASDSGTSDSGTPDAGGSDSGTGTPDSGSGTPDSGSGSTDSGTPDSGSGTSDSGTPDSGSGTSDSGTPDSGTLSQFALDMLAGHNATRASAKPTPSPALEPLTWDTSAEAVAQAHAAKCVFEHNGNRGNLGENIYAATPGAADTRGVVQGWSDEVADYDYAANTCAKDKQCGHYTQVVWRNTKRLGCATQTCTVNSPFGSRFPTWQFWVCNYAPPGNYVGQKPY